ncbi:glyceraldehyde 3-phosphate dehydrogenase NAD-binding domain-containing protein [Chromobacterium phragmitis]|nr:glyceraldehyde 3-phosphate dehydrogenase NAD-binding domain-containing protein [Chromobacterium phragmitis]
MILVDDIAQRLVGARYLNHPRMKIVFAGVNNRPGAYGYDQAGNVTGVLERKPLQAVDDTLEMLWRQMNGAGKPRALLIGDQSFDFAAGLFEYQDYQRRWRHIRWSAPVAAATFEEWKLLVLRAPAVADFILVSDYRQLRRDFGGKAFVPPAEVMAWTERNAKIPVLGLTTAATQDGAMMGVATAGYEQGWEAARMAYALTQGVPIRQLPIVSGKESMISTRRAAPRCAGAASTSPSSTRPSPGPRTFNSIEPPQTAEGDSMKPLRIGLNGLGRIGRALFRLNRLRRQFELAMINEVNEDAANLAYLLKYDTLYGTLPERVGFGRGSLSVEGQAIPLTRCADVTAAPWREHGVDVVIDASGDARHPARMATWNDFPGWTITTHAVAHPGVRTVIFGVNERDFDARAQRRLSSSICDTVALAPLAALLEREYGIVGGFVTTLHPWLGQQRLLDGAAVGTDSDAIGSHFSLGRAAAGNLIPKPTSVVQAADIALPGLARKLQAFSYRVPTPSVCSAVLDVELERPACAHELSALLRQSEQRQAWPVLRNIGEPLVSSDFRGSEHSLIVDQRWTAVQRERRARLVYWYDNEWGYASRVLDLAAMIAHAG